jgi:hypothetical protein
VAAARWDAGDISAAVAKVRRFAPDWVSLQMVSYAYERHGLLLRSPHRFAAFAPAARRHVMLHELWIAPAERASVVGVAQGSFSSARCAAGARTSPCGRPTYRRRWRAGGGVAVAR